MNGQVTIPNSMTLRDDQPPIAFESALNAMIIVAHPIEETLLAGGLMQMVPHWRWRVISFCPGPNRERRRTFFEAMKRFEAMGSIADLNEGYTQQPLHDETVESEIEFELPNSDFDLVITHNPFGEYSRHIRHEEVSRGVTSLWKRRLLRAKELWYFAYSDEERAHLPSAIETAHLSVSLSETVWQRKQEIMSDVYGFSKESWAYRTTPRHEAFVLALSFAGRGVFLAVTEMFRLFGYVCFPIRRKDHPSLSSLMGCFLQIDDREPRSPHIKQPWGVDGKLFFFRNPYASSVWHWHKSCLISVP